MAEASHRLGIFLCHSSGDKQAVRDLYKRLLADGFDPWLDEENLLPGQDWHQQIPEAVGAADIVLVCLSRGSINKKGYVQKEIKYALDVADEQPENTIYLIPLKLEECDIPYRLRRWHCVSLFEAKGYERLLNALRHRAESISANASSANLQSSSKRAPTSEPIAHQVLLERKAQLRETKEEAQGQDEEQQRWKELAKGEEESEEANRPRNRKAGQDEKNARVKIAAQEGPENIQQEVERQKRSKKLILAGIVVAMLGIIISIISFTRFSSNNQSNQPSNIYSTNAETYFNRGEECYEKKDYNCAIDNYSKAIELNAQYTEAFYRRGSVYSDTDRFDQAIVDFGKAIEFNPQYAEAFYNRGVAYDNKGDKEQAINDYSQAIKLNSQFTAAYNNRGLIYAARGDYRQAIKDYDEAIRLNPLYAIAYYNRGGTYDDIGNYDQATKDYDKAIELNPKYSEAYFNLGLIYHYKGHYRQAIEAYNKVIELNPQDADAFNARGLAYERLGQRDKAMADRQTYNELSAKR